MTSTPLPDPNNYSLKPWRTIAIMLFTFFVIGPSLKWIGKNTDPEVRGAVLFVMAASTITVLLAKAIWSKPK